jgi:hypothetical protein
MLLLGMALQPLEKRKKKKKNVEMFNGGRDVRGCGKGPRLRCCKDPAELHPLNVIDELVHSLPQMAEQGQALRSHFLPFRPFACGESEGGGVLRA